MVHGNVSKAKGYKGDTPDIRFYYDSKTGILYYSSDGVLIDKGYVSLNNLVTKEFLNTLMTSVVGNKDNLSTEDKSTIVAGINEVLNNFKRHTSNDDPDVLHLTRLERLSLSETAANVWELTEEVADLKKTTADNTEDIDTLTDIVDATGAELDTVIGIVNRLIAPPKHEVPTTLEVNTAYNFGSQNASLTLTFPSMANDGDVIYIGFVCREGLNLVVDTTNTFDFDLIPEKNTGYEIYAKCTTNLGGAIWIVKYSEYSGVGE